jgi:hypothetical protein
MPESVAGFRASENRENPYSDRLSDGFFRKITNQKSRRPKIEGCYPTESKARRELTIRIRLEDFRFGIGAEDGSSNIWGY